MQTDPAATLTPKTHGLRVLGLGLLGSGGCLMWTIVLIPIALPMALVGLVMFVWSFFQGKVVMTCPACHHALQIEPSVTVLVCPLCQKSSRFNGETWERIE